MRLSVRRPLLSVVAITVLLLALVVALSACAGGGTTSSSSASTSTGQTGSATQTSQTGTSQTATSGAVTSQTAGIEAETYTDATYGFTFKYPSGWELREGDTAEVTSGSAAKGNIAVVDPDGAVVAESYVDLVQVSVYELTQSVDESMMADIKPEVEGLLKSLEGQDSTWKQVEPLSDAKVAGVSGFKTSYTFSMGETPLKTTFYFLFHGDVQYQVTLQATADNWEKAQADFALVLNTFSPPAK